MTQVLGTEVKLLSHDKGAIQVLHDNLTPVQYNDFFKIISDLTTYFQQYISTLQSIR